MRKTLEAISLGALAVLVWITWQALHGPDHLPDRIPMHFDAAGYPNGWGKPALLLQLPIVAGVIYLLISLAARFPAYFNYPVRVTAENRPELETLALEMIVWLKTEVVCLIAWIQWSTIEVARQGHGGLSPALLPVSLVVLFGTLAWYIAAMRRAGHAGSLS